MDLWNAKNLKPPSVSTYKATNYEIDVARLSNLFKEAMTFFNDQHYLEAETALLSRCIYRMKTKFRFDKGLKAMEKTNRAMLQYLRMDFPGTLRVLSEVVPKKYSMCTYLPSKNLLDWVLVRTQSLAKLMNRVAGCSCEVANYMESKIAIGHFWKVAVIILGLISRVWFLVRRIVTFCCEFYGKLLPFAGKLQNGNVNWLPDDYKFPDSLEEWLGSENNIELHLPKWYVSQLELNGNFVDDDLEVLDKSVGLVKKELVNEDVECGETFVMKGLSDDISFETITDINLEQIVFEEEKNESTKNFETEYCKMELFENNAPHPNTNNYFEIEEKPNMKTTLTNNEKKIKNSNENDKIKSRKNKFKSQPTNLIENLKTAEDIRSFIMKENNLREKQSFGCLKNLDKLQWRMLSKNISKLIKKGEKSGSTKKSVTEAKKMLQPYLK